MKNWTLALALGALSLTACKKDEDPNEGLKDEVVSNYCEIVYASYSDSHLKAQELQTAINNLVAGPSATTLEAAKTAWKAAREPYGQTEAFRFYDGPIDDADGPEGDLNAWPLDENYIDYVEDASGNIVNGGIIYDTASYPILSKELLASLNEQGGEKNISIGYHAIEFLLWGQDDLDVNVNPGQGGDRSHTDFAGDIFAQRRAQYLQATTELLVEQLAELKAAWAVGASYRTTFEAMQEDVALAKILSGAAILSKSELAGERMFVALEANPADNPQEDEHSCFSDNTHRDIITNALGINNVLSGTYEDVNGQIIGDQEHSILALLRNLDEQKSANLETAMEEVMDKVNAIPTPFDKYVTQENVGDNGPVFQAITALQNQGDLLADAAVALGFTISTELPE
ncbi:imelysin family protein [Saprospira grandis]|uniref:imelysin family protein n=1 Tax=Saprospira grandis TaxID=1008 RepID=UPI0022DD86F5|nr:imelysin family protein [Saprospira grandis]WBM73768.1 peptidase M75 [Saprospira grandis]